MPKDTLLNIWLQDVFTIFLRTTSLCYNIYYLAHTKFYRVMKPDATIMKGLLRKRQSELQKLLQQMKHDNLHSSTVFKILHDELEKIKVELLPKKQD